MGLHPITDPAFLQPKTLRLSPSDECQSSTRRLPAPGPALAATKTPDCSTISTCKLDPLTRTPLQPPQHPAPTATMSGRGKGGKGLGKGGAKRHRKVLRDNIQVRSGF